MAKPKKRSKGYLLPKYQDRGNVKSRKRHWSTYKSKEKQEEKRQQEIADWEKATMAKAAKRDKSWSPAEVNPNAIDPTKNLIDYSTQNFTTREKEAKYLDRNPELDRLSSSIVGKFDTRFGGTQTGPNSGTGFSSYNNFSKIESPITTSYISSYGKNQDGNMMHMWKDNQAPLGRASVSYDTGKGPNRSNPDPATRADILDNFYKSAQNVLPQQEYLEEVPGSTLPAVTITGNKNRFENGGPIPKYQDKGDVTPYITSDLDDYRKRSELYNDSLYNYDLSQRHKEAVIDAGFSLRPNRGHKETWEESYANRHTAIAQNLSNNYDMGAEFGENIDILGDDVDYKGIERGKENYMKSLDYEYYRKPVTVGSSLRELGQTTADFWTALALLATGKGGEDPYEKATEIVPRIYTTESHHVPQYKKPTQPVIYKPETEIPDSEFISPEQLEFMFNSKKEEPKQKTTNNIEEISGKVVNKDTGESWTKEEWEVLKGKGSFGEARGKVKRQDGGSVPKYQDGDDVTSNKKAVILAETPSRNYWLGDEDLPDDLQILSNTHDELSKKEDQNYDEYQKQSKIFSDFLEGWTGMHIDRGQVPVSRYTGNPINNTGYRVLLGDGKRERYKYKDDPDLMATDGYKRWENSRNKLRTTQKERSDTRSQFMDLSSATKKTKNTTFLREADRMKSWYEKNNIPYDIHALYGNEDTTKLKEILGQEDIGDLVVMGHSGHKIAGIELENWNRFLGDSNYEHCVFGSCYGDKLVDSGLGDVKNLSHTTDAAWVGVNPRAETKEDFYFPNTNYVYNPEGTPVTTNKRKRKGTDYRGTLLEDHAAEIQSMHEYGGPITKYQQGADVESIPSHLLPRQAYKESTFRDSAKSSAGALGLTQFLPATFKELKEDGKLPEDADIYNIENSIQAQQEYVKELYNRPWNTKEDPTEEVRIAKTLGAYNYGPQNLVDFLNIQKEKGIDIYKTLDWVPNLPKETKDYIEYITGTADSEKYTTWDGDYKKALKNSEYKRIVDAYGEKSFTPTSYTRPYKEGENRSVLNLKNKEQSSTQNAYDFNSPDTLSREGIMDLQSELLEKDYYLGDSGDNKDGIDGDMGSRTRRAFEDMLNQEHGVEIDDEGEVGILESAYDAVTNFFSRQEESEPKRSPSVVTLQGDTLRGKEFDEYIGKPGAYERALKNPVKKEHGAEVDSVISMLEGMHGTHSNLPSYQDKGEVESVEDLSVTYNFEEDAASPRMFSNSKKIPVTSEGFHKVKGDKVILPGEGEEIPVTTEQMTEPIKVTGSDGKVKILEPGVVELFKTPVLEEKLPPLDAFLKAKEEYGGLKTIKPSDKKSTSKSKNTSKKPVKMDSFGNVY